jgi:hypothetical protein
MKSCNSLQQMIYNLFTVFRDILMIYTWLISNDDNQIFSNCYLCCSIQLFTQISIQIFETLHNVYAYIEDMYLTLWISLETLHYYFSGPFHLNPLNTFSTRLFLYINLFSMTCNLDPFNLNFKEVSKHFEFCIWFCFDSFRY